VRCSLEHLAEHRFIALAVRRLRHSMRELWPYIGISIPQRLELPTLMHARRYTLLLLLRDAGFDGADLRFLQLSALKDSDEPFERRGGELRETLRRPTGSSTTLGMSRAVGQDNDDMPTMHSHNK
jgi:hypothetical protein